MKIFIGHRNTPFCWRRRINYQPAKKPKNKYQVKLKSYNVKKLQKVELALTFL